MTTKTQDLQVHQAHDALINPYYILWPLSLVLSENLISSPMSLHHRLTVSNYEQVQTFNSHFLVSYSHSFHSQMSGSLWFEVAGAINSLFSLSQQRS